MPVVMKRILVLCTGNSCRSQIAEGYLRHFAGDRSSIFSAGIEAHGVNPKAVEIMKEDGIDISKQTSKLISEYAGIDFDFILTVCDNAKENCPYFPSRAIRVHHDFHDPAKSSGTPAHIGEQFRTVRNQIKEYCKIFVEIYLPKQP
jgi:arsenate reductase (thioredoxin)